MKSLMSFLGLLLLVPPAYADEGPASRLDGLTHMRVTLMLPGIMTGNYDTGVDAGIALDLRAQPLVVGLYGSAAYSGGTRFLVGVRAGYGLQLTPQVTLDFLGEVGLRGAQNGGGFLSEDPGTSTSEFFAGLRVALDYAVNSPSDLVTFRIGISAFGRLALSGSQQNTYTYESCGWLNLFDDGDDCRPVTETTRVGGVNDFGATLNLGLDFGGW